MSDGGGDREALAVATAAARAADEKQGRNIVVLAVGKILAIAAEAGQHYCRVG